MSYEKEITINLSVDEIKYLMSCGVALIQNVPEDSLVTYCGFDKWQIIDFSKKIKDVSESKGVEL